ncbi:MAG: PAS domain-containing sensor histidine kinase [Acidovorax sp.]|nr:MAG: PAS domain-containing sensor histidine kinase [Acidovorax sp.]
MAEEGGGIDFDPLEDLPCGVLTTDSKGLILHTNSTFCEWTGYHCDEVIGLRRLQDFLSMGGRIFYQTHLAPLLVMQGSVSEVKLDIQHHDKTTIPVVINAKRYQRNGAWFLRVAAFVARDRDKYERELLVSRQNLVGMVAEATRLKKQSEDRALFAEQMIGIVSHDLRNPLSTIRLGIQLLEKRGVTPDQKETLGRVHRAADRASQLIKDLLDFTSARIGSGLAVALKPVDLHHVVALAVEELSLAFPDRRIDHVLCGEGACEADANRVTQALGNLVANAVAYGQADTDITVTSSVASAGWRVSVHNWGVPIAPEAIEQLFMPMVRGVAEDSGNRNVGLGLFIVNEIAKAHGGGLDVTSTQELGTEFSLGAPHAGRTSG